MPVIPPGAKRISSRATMFYKWVFPIFMNVILGYVFLEEIMKDDGVALITILGGLVLLFLSLFLFWNLRTLDKVYRSGDHLLVSNNGATEKIEISDIDGVRFRSGGRGPNFVIITMKDKKLTRWGMRIKFIPIFPFSDEDLRYPQVFIDLEKRMTELRR